MGLKVIFLIVSRTMSLLRLSRRESWRKDAEILMLRHQLSIALREQPRTHSRLTWPDRAWLALLAGTLPIDLWVPKTYATWADAVRSAGGFRLVYVRRLEGWATGGMIFGLWAWS